jgi:hypothetical protein
VTAGAPQQDRPDRSEPDICIDGRLHGAWKAQSVAAAHGFRWRNRCHLGALLRRIVGYGSPFVVVTTLSTNGVATCEVVSPVCSPYRHGIARSRGRGWEATLHRGSGVAHRLPRRGMSGFVHQISRQFRVSRHPSCATPNRRNTGSVLFAIRIMVRPLFRYPDPVNENAARLIAGGVLMLSLAFLVTGNGLAAGILAYGFVARVLTGQTMSPLAQFVNRFVVPRFSVPTKLVPGPPKRFAQGIGAVLSVGALAASVSGLDVLAVGLVGVVAMAATLESVFAICVGCLLFGRLMAIGLVPASVCEACNDLSAARPREQGSTEASVR